MSDSVTLNVAVNNILDKDLGKTVDVNGTTYYKYLAQEIILPVLIMPDEIIGCP